MGKDKGSSGHEFTASENKILKEVSLAMLIVALGWFLYGVQVAYAAWVGMMMASVLKISFVVILPFLAISALLFALGAYLIKAMNAMRTVTETEGDDITHFMRAIDGLRSYFKIGGIIVLTIVGFTVLGFLLAL
jgi:hypothetical protein